MFCVTNRKSDLLVGVVVLLGSLVLGCTQIQAQEGTRPASIVYPLDAVVSKDGAVWVVDRNRPGVWKFFDGKLTLEVEGSKRYREPMNAARCLAISPEGELARFTARMLLENGFQQLVVGLGSLPIWLL